MAAREAARAAAEQRAGPGPPRGRQELRGAPPAGERRQAGLGSKLWRVQEQAERGLAESQAGRGPGLARKGPAGERARGACSLAAAALPAPAPRPAGEAAAPRAVGGSPHWGSEPASCSQKSSPAFRSPQACFRCCSSSPHQSRHVCRRRPRSLLAGKFQNRLARAPKIFAFNFPP